MKMIKIINGKIVTPEAVEHKKVLLIKKGKILDICNDDVSPDIFEVVDAKGNYVIPGLVDIHCDALEFKMFPRPNVTIPPLLALSHYEKELLISGITINSTGSIGEMSLRNIEVLS